MHSLHPLDVDAHVAYVQERRSATVHPRRRPGRRAALRTLFHRVAEVVTACWAPRQQRGAARRTLEA